MRKRILHFPVYVHKNLPRGSYFSFLKQEVRKLVQKRPQEFTLCVFIEEHSKQTLTRHVRQSTLGTSHHKSNLLLRRGQVNFHKTVVDDGRPSLLRSKLTFTMKCTGEKVQLLPKSPVYHDPCVLHVPKQYQNHPTVFERQK